MEFKPNSVTNLRPIVPLLRVSIWHKKQRKAFMKTNSVMQWATESDANFVPENVRHAIIILVAPDLSLSL